MKPLHKRIDFDILSAYLQSGTDPASYFIHRNEPGELKTPFAFVNMLQQIHITKRDMTAQEFFALHHLVNEIFSQSPQTPTDGL